MENFIPIEQLDPQIITTWFHYEEIAMHFNELLIQYRLKLLGGLGGLGALSTYIVGKNKINEADIRRMRAYIATALVVVFLAAAALDVFYYRLLLEGAVSAIVALENQYPALNMSTSIKNQFDRQIIPVIWWVYLAVFIPLIAFTLYSWISYFRKK